MSSASYKRRALKVLLAAKRIKISGAAGLPLRIRPAFVALTFLTLLILSALGFHPTLASKTRINDKLLHFVCFAIATGCFVWVFEVDTAARRMWIWRHFQALLTGVVCFGFGAIGSEFVQAMLPYKQFDFFDIVANICGASLGLWIATLLERRHRRQRELAALYQPLDPADAYPSDDETELGEGMVGAQSRAQDAWRDSVSEVFSLGEDEDDRPRK